MPKRRPRRRVSGTHSPTSHAPAQGTHDRQAAPAEVRGQELGAPEQIPDLPAPRLALGLRARDYGVAEARELDGRGLRALRRGEAREEDRAQIHGYRESATHELGVSALTRVCALGERRFLLCAFARLDESKNVD